MSNIQAIQNRIAELKRERTAADLAWIEARGEMAAVNLRCKTRLQAAERKLKEAKLRYKNELAKSKQNNALNELSALTAQFNSDSKRLAQSLREANNLMMRCPPGSVEQLSFWQPENLPMLLNVPGGKVVMRPRGIKNI